MRQYCRNDFNYGVVLVLLSAIVWGVSYPLWKVIFQQVHPLVLTSITFLFASTLIFVMKRLSPANLYSQFQANKLFLLLLGLSSGLLGSGLICYSLSRVDAGIVSILEKLQPIFTVITARIFLHDYISFIDFSLLFQIILASYLSLFLAFELFFTRLKHIDYSTASYLELVTPVFAILFGMIFLSERLDVYQVFALPVFFYCIYRLSVTMDEA